MNFLTLIHSVRFYFHIAQEKAQVLGLNMYSTQSNIIYTAVRSNHSRENDFPSPPTPKTQISTLQIRFFSSLHSSLALRSINLYRVIVIIIIIVNHNNFPLP